MVSSLNFHDNQHLGYANAQDEDEKDNRFDRTSVRSIKERNVFLKRYHIERVYLSREVCQMRSWQLESEDLRKERESKGKGNLEAHRELHPRPLAPFKLIVFPLDQSPSSFESFHHQAPYILYRISSINKMHLLCETHNMIALSDMMDYVRRMQTN
jgi:hypothetical protein